jgi:hypothetical protein
MLLLPNLSTKLFAKLVKLLIRHTTLFNLAAKRRKKLVDRRRAQRLFEKPRGIRGNVFADCLCAFPQDFFTIRR